MRRSRLVSFVLYVSSEVCQRKVCVLSDGIKFLGKKEELIVRLVQSDELSAKVGHSRPMTPQESQEFLSADEMRELATIADEMRHIRRQWVRFY